MRSSEIVMHTMETCAMESEFSEHLLGYLDFLDQCVSVNMCFCNEYFLLKQECFLDQCVSVNMCCATRAILNTACNLCCAT